MTISVAVSATLWVPAPPAETAAVSVLGLPLPRRTALAAARAGFPRIFFEARHEGDLREILSGTPAKIVTPQEPLPQLTGRLILLAPDVIPQVPWLRSLLARPFQAGTFLFDVEGGAVAVLDAARPEDLAVVLAAARRSGLAEARAAGQAAGVPLSRPTDVFVVRGPADLPSAERWLLQSLIKDSEGFFSRHFERRISLGLTRRLVRTPITPNAMTLVSVGVGLAGAALFLSAAAAFQFAGALLFLLHSILDGCDGELARVKFAESRFGGVLDFWGDNVVHSAVFGCLAVGWSRAAGDPRPLLAGAAAIAGALLSAGFVYRHAMGEVREGPQFTSVTSAPASRFSRLADALARRDFIYVLILLSAFGKAHWFLVLMAVGAPVFFFFLVAIEASARRLGRSLS